MGPRIGLSSQILKPLQKSQSCCSSSESNCSRVTLPLSHHPVEKNLISNQLVNSTIQFIFELVDSDKMLSTSYFQLDAFCKEENHAAEVCANKGKENYSIRSTKFEHSHQGKP